MDRDQKDKEERSSSKKKEARSSSSPSATERDPRRGLIFGGSVQRPFENPGHSGRGWSFELDWGRAGGQGYQRS